MRSMRRLSKRPCARAPVSLLASLPTTMAPTCSLIQSKAQDAGNAVIIREELAHEAFKPLANGYAEPGLVAESDLAD